VIALLLAAVVTAQPAPAPNEVAIPRQTEPMPNAYSQPAYCPSVVEQEVRRQATAMHGQAPGAEYAVLRQLDGCGVPTPIGYHPPYLLPGAADPTSKRGDAPANRR
jgi:hypothetical protein